MRKMQHIVSIIAVAAAVFACGGNKKKAHNAGEEAEAMPELVMNEPEPEEAEGHVEGDKEESSGESEEAQFTPGMSVEEASSAAPFAVNAVEVPIEQLEKPLMGSAVYAPCSIPGGTKYKVKVAVYQGKAVGIDVTTEPANETIDACVKEQIAAIEWEVKEDSLNTVELSF